MLKQLRAIFICDSAHEYVIIQASTKKTENNFACWSETHQFVLLHSLSPK